MSKKIIYGGSAVAILGVIALLVFHITLKKKEAVSEAKPDMFAYVDFKEELIDKAVAVPSVTAPDGVLIWKFSKNDDLVIKYEDVFRFDNRANVYVTVAAKSTNDYRLYGILEINYIQIGWFYHIVGLNSINLQITEPAKPEPTKPEDKQPTKPKSQTEQAQPLPIKQ